MAKAEFYFIYINRKPDVTYEAVEKKMDLSYDWYRVNQQIWILYTTSSAEKWYKRLSSLVKDNGNLFICKLDIIDRQGWMDKSFWEWIRQQV